MATELELARAVATGAAPSPSQLGAFELRALRVSGTGRAERVGLRETVWRDPILWLSDDFLQRCNGLPVIWDHPPAGILDSKEYGDRVIGSVLLPYRANAAGVADEGGSEVWGIARVHDDPANEALRKGNLSTSPAVTFTPAETTFFELPNGERLLIEGVPSLIDHLAVCEAGVWDCDGPPSRVRNDSVSGEKDMAEEVGDEKLDTAPESAGEHPGVALDKILKHLDGLGERLGALTSRMDAWEESKDKPADEKLASDDDRNATEIEHGEAKRIAADSRYAARLDAEQAVRDAQIGAQVKADSAYQSFGQRAPAPQAGESIDRYRRRLARGLQRFAKDGFNKIDIAKLSGDALDAIEGKIYADAIVASSDPGLGAPPGELIERKRMSGAGHTISEFFARDKTQTYIRDFKGPARRVIGFNTKAS